MPKGNPLALDICRDGAWFRLCSVCGDWLLRDRHFQEVFDKRYATLYRQRRCRDCRAVEDGKERRIPLSQMIHHIDWMIGVVGWHETRRRIGISKGSLSHWTNGNVRYIARSSARLLIEAAFYLRQDVASGLIVPLSRNRAKHHCSGCGGELDNFTNDCSLCEDRKRARERRLTDERYKASEHRRYVRRRDAA